LTLTGFLSEPEYAALLLGSDVIIDLTRFDHCLVCGAYEAVSAGRTFVLSEKQANRELFGDVPVYVESNENAILAGVKAALSESAEREKVTAGFRKLYEADWASDFSKLDAIITELESL